MAKKQVGQQATVSEQVRHLIETSGLTRYRIAQETGIAESTLTRFIAGQRTLSSDALNKLGRFLNFEVVMHGPNNRKGK